MLAAGYYHTDITLIVSRSPATVLLQGSMEGLEQLGPARLGHNMQVCFVGEAGTGQGVTRVSAGVLPG